MTLFEELSKSKDPYKVIIPPSLQKPITVKNPSTYKQGILNNGKFSTIDVTKGEGTISTPKEKSYGGLEDFQKDVVQKSFKDIGKLAKDLIITPPLRATGSLFKTIGNQKEWTPETQTEKFLLGEKPIKSLQQRTKESSEMVQEKTGLSKNISTPLAFGGVLGMTALDLSPFGGEKNAAKEIIKVSKLEDAIKLGKKLGIAEDKINEFADVAITTKNMAGAKSLINAFNKPIESPIIQEAKKYKSAEEFVKGNDLIFQGVKDGKQSNFWSTDIEMARKYAGKDGKINVAKFGDMPEDLRLGLNKQEYTSAKNPIISADKARQPNIITTLDNKSQLTDIWNEANKIAPEAKLGATNKLERGFVTSAKKVVPEAKKIAGQYVPRSTDELAIKAKNLIKTDLNAAEDLALHGMNENAVATASELLKHYSDEAEKATDQAIKNALYDKAAHIANTIAPKLTEQGRTIQAASILGRLTPEGQVKFAAGEISRYNEGVSIAKKIPELKGEQAKYILDEMKSINNMAEGSEKAIKFQKLQEYITKLVPTPTFKKIIAVWKAGLLTGLKTTGVNIFANLSHFGTEVVKDIPATIADKIISLFTGKRAVTLNIKNIGKGAKEGLNKGLQYLKTGFDERNIGTKLDFKKVNFGKGKISEALQKYTDTVFRLMGSEDQPFYYGTKLRSLYEQAKVAAINAGKKGEEAQKFIDNLIENPTDEMIKYASIDAETAVFQNQTALSKAASGITREVPMAEIIIPFRRTPSAVAMQIINYTPLGIAKEVLMQIKNGHFDQRLLSQAIGRGLTGTAFLGIGANLAKDGLITTSRPTSSREQKQWELEGKQPNSIKIGGKWRQVNTLGPAGNVLLIGASFQNAYKDTGTISGAMAQGLADASKAFTQQTFLTGVSNFIDAISDPMRSASYVIGNTLASSIPTIVSDIARATDTKERRSNTIFDKLLVRIPGLRETLEPQVNVLGEEIETPNPLEVMIDPTRPSVSKDSPVISEIQRLSESGFNVSPTLLGDKSGYSSLTPEENTNLWKRSGEIINNKLQSLFSSTDYQNLDNEQKSKIVNNFVDKSKIVARAEAVLNITQNLKGEELKKKLSELKKSGLLTKEVFNKWEEIR